MRLRMKAGESYTVFGGFGGFIKFTKSDPEHEVPDDVAQRSGMLKERVPIFNQRGDLVHEVQRFVEVKAARVG